MGLTYCSTTPHSDTDFDQADISVSVDHDVSILEEVRLLIENGSFSSLNKALFLLETENAGATEQGEYDKFIIGSLLKLVFPLAEKSEIRVISPKSGVSSDIVEKAFEGEIIEIPNNEVNFFTLLLSSTAALYTDSEAVQDRSMEIIETIYTSESNSFLPLYIRSFLYEKQKLYKKAFSGYLESLKIDPLSYCSELGVIRILIRNNEYKEALSHLENVQDKYGQYEELIYLTADALIGNNELEKAFNIVSEALSKSPDNMVLTLKYADILQKKGENTRALHLINTIESSAGVTLASISIRSEILVNTKKYNESLHLLDKALQKYPDDPKLRELYGRILLLTGKDLEGRAFLENSLELNPDNLGSIRLLTEEAILVKSWERASEYVEKLLKKEFKDEYLRYAVEIYHNLGNNKKAAEYNLQIINIGQPLHSDYYIAVDMYIKEGKIQTAINLLDEWIKLSTNSVDRSYFYFLKSLVSSDPKVRLDILRQALFENLQNLDAIIAISDTYYELGEKRNSYRYLKQALILVPDNESVKEKLRKLEKEL